MQKSIQLARVVNQYYKKDLTSTPHYPNIHKNCIDLVIWNLIPTEVARLLDI